MKILLATPLYPPEPGGPATYAKLLCEELPKRGIEVVLVKFSDVRHLPPGIRHLAYFLKCLWLGRKTKLIYALDPVSVGLPAMYAAKALGRKFLLRVPGDYAWEQGKQRFGVKEELDEFQSKTYDGSVERLRRMQKRVAEYATAIVVPSEYMKRVVSGWVHDSSKIKTIYSSIHLPIEFELPKERPQGFLVVSFGRNVPWKGFDALAEVVSRNAGWTLKLFTDLPHKEAMGWLKVADVYVNNSTYEGLSHQLVEALALGTPVIATNIGGNPELIQNYVHGLLVPAKDNEALFKALSKVAADRESALKRAEAGKERAKEFSIELAIEKVVTLLNQICAS